LLVILFLLIEMLPANTMCIIDEDCAATSMTSGGDDGRRIAYILHEAGIFFPSRISQFEVECIIPTHHAKICFDNECKLSLTASVFSSTGSVVV
jgi:hypothetical protein